MSKPYNDAERRRAFWKKVYCKGASDCWPWLATKDHGGYGQFNDGRQMTTAHRFAYYAIHGYLPEGLQINHKCNNPECCNPAHLYAGTASQNNYDRAAAGNYKSVRLSAEDIRLIQVLHTKGVSHRKLATLFGCSKSLIQYYLVK